MCSATTVPQPRNFPVKVNKTALESLEMWALIVVIERGVKPFVDSKRVTMGDSPSTQTVASNYVYESSIRDSLGEQKGARHAHLSKFQSFLRIFQKTGHTFKLQRQEQQTTLRPRRALSRVNSRPESHYSQREADCSSRDDLSHPRLTAEALGTTVAQIRPNVDTPSKIIPVAENSSSDVAEFTSNSGRTSITDLGSTRSTAVEVPVEEGPSQPLSLLNKIRETSEPNDVPDAPPTEEDATIMQLNSRGPASNPVQANEDPGMPPIGDALPTKDVVHTPSIRQELTNTSIPPGPLPAPARSHSRLPEFREIDKSLFEATRIQPQASLRAQWTEAWRTTLNKRLMDLHLGQHVITNLRFCMTGSSPDPASMRPTILLICPEVKRKDVQNGLAEFIKVAVPSCVDFRIVVGKVKPSSGGGLDGVQEVGSQTDVGSRLDLETHIIYRDLLPSLVGCMVNVQVPSSLGVGYFRACTIGGMIAVDNSLFALSVAHSMFESEAIVSEEEILDNKDLEDPFLQSCGFVDSYRWSRNGESMIMAASSGARITPQVESKAFLGTDWMLIRLRDGFQLPNLVYGPTHRYIVGQINGHRRVDELTDDEVWVCSGVSGTQTGFLSCTLSLVTYGSASYDVFPIMLEHPLGKQRVLFDCNWS